MLLSDLENLISGFRSGATLHALQWSGSVSHWDPVSRCLTYFSVSNEQELGFLLHIRTLADLPKLFEENKEKSSVKVAEMLSSGCR